MSMVSNKQLPTIEFSSKITEVVKRLTAAYENLCLIKQTYGITPDENFVFDQNSFDEFVCSICEKYYNSIYSKKGIAKTFSYNIKGDILNSVLDALEKNKDSVRLILLANKLIQLSKS